jgi:hypothetical protein
LSSTVFQVAAFKGVDLRTKDRIFVPSYPLNMYAFIHEKLSKYSYKKFIRNIKTNL